MTDRSKEDAGQGEVSPMLGRQTTVRIVPTLKQSHDGPAQERPRHSNSKAVFAQCMVAGGVCVLGAAAGFPIGFSAVLLPQLQHPNSSLSTDDDMASWIASIHSAATPVGSFFSGMLSDRWGRKLALMVSTLPYIMGWLTLALANSHALILAGRVICGVAVGLIAVPAQVILGEVAEPRIRGLLSGAPHMSYSLGILVVYILGASLEWHLAAGLGVILPLVALAVFSFLPESPVWLARHGRVEEASKALVWLRGDDAVQAKRELRELITRLRAEDETVQLESVCGSQKNIGGSQKNIGLGGSQKILSSIKNTLSASRPCNAYCQQEYLKPLMIVATFMLLQIVCGTYLVIFYAVSLITRADEERGVTGNEAINPFLAAVLTAVVRFMFVCIASTLLFWVGRRPLAIVSGVATSVAALALGTFLYHNGASEEPSPHASWIIAGLLLCYVAANTLGFFVLPGVAVGELLPVKIRGAAGGYVFTIFNLALFGMTKVFPSFADSLGGHGVFWFFGLSTLLCTVFVYLFVPESKGRTLQEIEDYFKEKNIMWISRNRDNRI
uniref:Major facilitator superfamily (MFS) profile domain-containing protein n=1 Tax=Timema monikensis TaxID=170555 RepID=A0A7R9HSI0_9NEOP|nr:unnamed protein product [Timema monikensis]